MDKRALYPQGTLILYRQYIGIVYQIKGNKRFVYWNHGDFSRFTTTEISRTFNSINIIEPTPSL